MKRDWKTVFGVSILVGGVASLFTSSSPDGLEKVAEMQGFFEQGKQFFVATIPDYMMPGIQNEKLATSLAGIAGTSAVFTVLVLIGKYLYRFNLQEK